MYPAVHSSIMYSYQSMEAVCVHQQMNGQTICDGYIYIHTYNGILLSHKNKWNFAIFSNTDGLWGHYAKWNKLDKNTSWYHLYVELKIIIKKK